MAEGNSSGGFWQGIGGALVNAGATVAGNVFAGKSGLKRQYKYWQKMSDYQQSINRANAEWALAEDRKMKEWQNLYDSPASQMERYKAAGLNPNLIYGQGTPGNMGSVPQMQNIAGPQMQALDANYMRDIGTQFNQARLMQSQANLTDTRVVESQTKQELNEAQARLVAANPNLNPAYISALVSQFESAATIKSQEAAFAKDWTSDKDGTRWERGYLKMQRELDLLEQKYDLAKKDNRVRAEIIESKEFENTLKEIEVKFMKDGEITPRHMIEFTKMLLSGMTKIMTK
ncbi:MAG: hypothetical protein QXT77_07415 [Candidatus Methanomethylicaceae archaeon]